MRSQYCRNQESPFDGIRIIGLLFSLTLMSAVVACGSKSDIDGSTGAAPESAEFAAQTASGRLTASDVQLIIAQAASKAQAIGFAGTIAVLDREGIRLGVLRMAGAATMTTISGGGAPANTSDPTDKSLEGVAVNAEFAAISKAGTAALFGTQGFALSTRTTNFVLQERFPPGVNPSPGGPLLGVQFSQFQCSDVNRTGHPASAVGLPLGLSADPGGLPLYKNGVSVGGIGVEGDLIGVTPIYTFDPDATDTDQALEEVVAAVGTLGFSAPIGIRADRILVDGLRLPFANAEPESITTSPYSSFAATGTELVVPIASPASGFQKMTIGGVSGWVDPTSSPVPFIAGTDGLLTAADVEQIIGQTARQAERTRSALRLPLGLSSRTSMTVVDTNGVILGMFRNDDAPVESWDISVQKARTANFFMRPDAGTILTANGFGNYVSALAGDGIPLDGRIAFSVRGLGFLAYPIFPPGATRPASFGPLSKPIGTWSIFNNGLQLDLLDLGAVLGTNANPCTSLTAAPSGIQLFPQGVPLFKNGVHVGALGLSGDGADQDDIIPVLGSAGFEAPQAIRSDQVEVRGVRLPFAVFPRLPDL